jgi:predicted DNA-binding protein (UPF0251 family)
MGSARIDSMVPNLFSAASPREHVGLPPNPPIPTANSEATSSPRHVLPNDLPTAIKQLNDQELDQLQAAVTAEQERRGKKPHAPVKTPNKRPVEAASEVSLKRGQVNAIRAAFKAGVTPSRIARQFGIPQSDVRKTLASE